MAIICNLLFCTIFVAIFINAICIAASSKPTNYCNLQSCKPNIHTMCKYKSNNLGSACVNHSDRGLTNKEKNAIVNKHNEFRQRVASGKETRGNPGPQPPAASMPNLSWDNELETIAQRWADQCNFSHDECRNVERYPVGQNIVMTMSTGKNGSPVEDMIGSWYNEVAKMDRREVEKLTGKNFHDIGHYTQLVSDKSHKIGCGRIKYRGQNGWNNQFLVCNYGPAGNYIGQKIYEIKK
ncbi:venom allergen 3-like [Pseudomyrmex gracilis]|uniref:venom allergen 3-like n=1 Tax=Pseudomyrmex gracilis TaxID=219809 RepID=UPI0009956A92|nr:venom allergen 3-like [Pseudomyrmex gracilis]